MYSKNIPYNYKEILEKISSQDFEEFQSLHEWYVLLPEIYPLKWSEESFDLERFSKEDILKYHRLAEISIHI